MSVHDGFKLYATPHVTEASCKCGEELQEVSNGFLSTAMFCPKCEAVYALKLVKVDKRKVPQRFVAQSYCELPEYVWDKMSLDKLTKAARTHVDSPRAKRLLVYIEEREINKGERE